MSPRVCYRCGEPGAIDQIDVTSFGDVGRQYITRAWCATPGCAEPDGSRRLDPPDPIELFRQADAMWRARHERFIRGEL